MESWSSLINQKVHARLTQTLAMISRSNTLRSYDHQDMGEFVTRLLNTCEDRHSEDTCNTLKNELIQVINKFAMRGNKHANTVHTAMTNTRTNKIYHTETRTRTRTRTKTRTRTRKNKKTRKRRNKSKRTRRNMRKRKKNTTKKKHTN